MIVFQWQSNHWWVTSSRYNLVPHEFQPHYQIAFLFLGFPWTPDTPRAQSQSRGCCPLRICPSLLLSSVSGPIILTPSTPGASQPFLTLPSFQLPIFHFSFQMQASLTLPLKPPWNPAPPTTTSTSAQSLQVLASGEGLGCGTGSLGSNPRARL